MLTFFILGGAALILLMKPSLFRRGDRYNEVVDLGFMEPGDPNRPARLGGSGANTGTEHETGHQTTLQDDPTHQTAHRLEEMAEVPEILGNSKAD